MTHNQTKSVLINSNQMKIILTQSAKQDLSPTSTFFYIKKDQKRFLISLLHKFDNLDIFLARLKNYNRISEKHFQFKHFITKYTL